MGIAFTLTTRGIPQLYYGTEILMANESRWKTDEAFRADFPGGWANDPKNKFTAAGRSPLEQEAFTFVKTLADFRQAKFST